jgi:phage-related protein
MPAGSTIVGRIAVKVVPDTSKFKEQAQAGIERAERGLKATVHAKLDTNSLKRSAIAAIREINNENKTIGARKIKFRATIDTGNFRSVVRDARRELQRIANEGALKFDVDKLDVAQAKLTLDRDSLDDIERQLDRWRKRVSPIKVEVEPNLDGIAIASARLAILSRPRKVDLIPVVNSAASAKAATALAALSGARVVSTYLDDMTDALSRLDKSVPSISAITVAIGGLAALSLTAASNTFAIVNSLASIVPAALALPGILGGIAIGVGVTVAALKDFNQVFPDVKRAFSEMQDLISENFWAKAEAPMRRMLDELLPALASGFEKTATALGGYFAGIGDGIRSILVSKLGSMFDDLNESIEIATKGTGALVGIITTLGSVGAGYLPRLAKWFVDVTERFNAFLSAAAGDGRLVGWIDTAIVALRDLGRVLFNVGKIIGDIGQAALAAGGSSLSVMADTLERVAAITAGAQFQSNLTMVFRAAHEAMSQIGTISGPALVNLFETMSVTLAKALPLVGSIIGTLVEGLANAMSNPIFQGALVGLFEGLLAAAVALAPAIEPVFLALSAILPVVGELAKVIAPLLAEVLTHLSQALVLLAPHVAALIPLLGAGLLAAVKVLGPVLVDIARYISVLIWRFREWWESGDETRTKLSTAFAAIIAAAKSVRDYWVETLWPAVSTVFSDIRDLIERVWADISEAFSTGEGDSKASLDGITEALRSLGRFLATWAEAFVVTLGVYVKLATVLWDTFGRDLFETAREQFGNILGVVTGILGVLEGVLNVFTGALTGDWSRAFEGIRQITGSNMRLTQNLLDIGWEAIKLVFKLGWAAVKQNTLDAVLGLPRIAREALSNIGTVLVDAGRRLIQGFINGIGEKFRDVRSKLSELTGLLPDWKGPANKDKVLLEDAGRLVMDGFISGLESRYDAVRRSLKGLSSDVAGTSFATPGVALPGVSGGAAAALNGRLAGVESSPMQQNVLNYYAAAGSSLNAEEDLFAAASRTRMVGW